MVNLGKEEALSTGIVVFNQFHEPTHCYWEQTVRKVCKFLI